PVAPHPPGEPLLHRRDVVWARPFRASRGSAVAVLVELAANVELAVVGLLRRAALEDDHRRARVGFPEVGDVEALDPHGHPLQPEVLLERRERLHPLLAATLATGLFQRARQPRGPA